MQICIRFDFENKSTGWWFGNASVDEADQIDHLDNRGRWVCDTILQSRQNGCTGLNICHAGLCVIAVCQAVLRPAASQLQGFTEKH